MKENIYIIHHTDNDGFCSAALITYIHPDDNIKYFGYSYRENKPFQDFVDEALENANLIYVVDISIGDFESHPYIEKLSKSPKLIWIDHHLTSINSQEKYGYLKEIPGIRRTDRSGAWLCYEWVSEIIKNAIPEEAEFCKSVPEVVKLVDDHDRFEHAMEGSLPFSNGTYMRCSPTDPNWQMWDDLLHNDEKLLEDILREGRVICQYNDMQYQKARRNAGICILEDRRDKDEVKKYLGVIINYVANSLVFGEQLTNGSKVFGIVYYYSYMSKSWMYSIYSADPNFDCSKVAEYFRGGGHKGAAGFSSDELLIKNGILVME